MGFAVSEEVERRLVVHISLGKTGEATQQQHTVKWVFIMPLITTAMDEDDDIRQFIVVIDDIAGEFLA